MADGTGVLNATAAGAAAGTAAGAAAGAAVALFLRQQIEFERIITEEQRDRKLLWQPLQGIIIVWQLAAVRRGCRIDSVGPSARGTRGAPLRGALTQLRAGLASLPPPPMPLAFLQDLMTGTLNGPSHPVHRQQSKRCWWQ